MIELCPTNKCTGCGACYNACPRQSITMVESVEGFLFPEINDETCVNCGLCRKVCPVMAKPEEFSSPRVYATWNIDDGIRTTSSSGGMFYTLAKDVIDRGGIVFGVVLDEEGNVYHTYTDNLAGLKPMQGSKYVQSDTRKVFLEVKKYLSEGRLVMFTGTPCQVAAMKSFIGKISCENLLLVDIVCHGVPANKLFKDYLNKLEQKYGEKIKKSSFCFRKLDAWGYSPSIEFAEDSRKIIPQCDNVYMLHFLMSFTFRESCYQCQFSSSTRVSDITIADFWGIGKNIPFNGDTTKGCSLVLVNTEKGNYYFEAIKSNIFCEQRNLDEAKVDNLNLCRPSIRPSQRDNSYNYFYSHSIEQVYSKYYNNLYLRLRRFVGKSLRKIGFLK